MNTTIRPARATAPGKIILRELEARGWSQQDLAEIIGRPEQAVSEIIQAKKQITAETARQLARAFGTSIDFWLGLEMNYQLTLAEKQAQELEIERKSVLYDLAPIKEITRRGWIHPNGSLQSLENEVFTFLGITNPAQQPVVAGHWRIAEARGPEERSKTAWLKRVEWLAARQSVGKFSSDNLNSVVEQLCSLSVSLAGVAAIPDVLLTSGIHFIVVKNLPKTFIDGAAFRMDGHPVIACSLRYDRVDSFWFTLLHELAHIVSDHGQHHIDELFASADREVQVSVEESEANTLALSWLLDRNAFEQFIQQHHPYYSKKAITDFAASQHRHPGIVVGQLMYRKEIEYRQNRAFLEKVSPLLERWMDGAQPG